MFLNSIHLEGLLEARLQRPIDPDVSEPGFSGVRLDPIAFLSSRRCWATVEIDASIDVGLKPLRSGGEVHDPGFVFENNPFLDIVHGDRPKVGYRWIRFNPELIMVFSLVAKAAYNISEFGIVIQKSRDYKQIGVSQLRQTVTADRTKRRYRSKHTGILWCVRIGRECDTSLLPERQV